jgi:hypothetical protein
MAKIAGYYQLAPNEGKSNFHCEANNITIVVAQRKTTAPNKPPKYILQKLAKSKYKYISSLFPIDQNTFSIDHEGQIFIFKYLSDNTAQITPKFY